MRVRITEEPVHVEDVLADLASPQDGAVVLFTGIVRNHSEGRRVSAVAYEAYQPMAERVLREIAQEAVQRLGTDRLSVVHRVGELRVGEVSVAIAAASAHRAEAFDACRYVIEEIKVRLPAWKKERYVEGDSRWVPGHEPAGSSVPGA